ncbi:patellin-3-like [Rutidosis leptorrhynchoides]|uniref:patellin-3-like n=1 Tax=Rutidosis leptorrhynchoides TaxID=125765 RepID=UPI003A9915AC
MAEETLVTQPQPAEVAVVSNVPEPETCEKVVPVPEPEPEPVKDVVVEDDKKVTSTASFKEETNVVGELPDPHKIALDELKQLVQQALNKHEFSPPPAPVTEKPAAEEKISPVGGQTDECKKEEKGETAAEDTAEPAASESSEKQVTDEDGAKKIEAIEETIVKTEKQPAVETPVEPEEVWIWGIPLLADDRSDVILLKFLRARDFKVKEALIMLKNVVAWRKEFDIESLIKEDLGTEKLEKVVFMHGVDKEGHPVCYNAVAGETFSDEEKRNQFIKWRIQLLEKSIRKLDFSPNGISTIVQVNDLKSTPAPFRKELRQVFQLFQDNYPEFVARQVFINVPWWYIPFFKVINTFFTQRTKSKFVFAGPSKTTETLFKYISPDLVPVIYGGLSREGEQEFTTTDCIIEEIIKPSCEHKIELSASETCTLVWEARVVGSEVSYGAEFVPSKEDGYTVIVQKLRKVTSDESVISGRFKCGETGKVVLTLYNRSSKKKKVVYRFKKVASD